MCATKARQTSPQSMGSLRSLAAKRRPNVESRTRQCLLALPACRWLVALFHASDAPARTSDSGSGTPLQPALPRSRMAFGMHDTDDLNRVRLHEIQHLVRKPPGQRPAHIPVNDAVPQRKFRNGVERGPDLLEEFVPQACAARFVPGEGFRQIGLRLRPDDQAVTHGWREVMRA